MEPDEPPFPGQERSTLCGRTFNIGRPEAMSLRSLGAALRAVGDVDAARAVLGEALVLFEELDESEANIVREEIAALATP
ncbi:hypothetical protein [Saccharopolyspora sp. ASAGF58]|uniref:hypothetical protein n=1 Tax=Saccharopolyspora sp. ASAGF58 TaxID=2719023 RepID=UPI00144020DF|nr:hypothetical protein [Saccharopolyspora sp. ASAGF58]QIZ35255.1 hypothetical protein FDZ84_11750 [Saccharopolyspora sp. ASAGF58]